MSHHLGPTRRQMLVMLAWSPLLAALPSRTLAQQQLAPELRSQRGRFVPGRSTVHAIAGRPLVVRLIPADDAAPPPDTLLIPQSPPRVRLADLEIPGLTTVWIAPGGVLSAGSAWVPPVPLWRATPLPIPEPRARSSPVIDPGPSPERGFWAVVVPTPADAHGRRLTIDGVDVPLVWFDQPPPTTGSANAPRPIGSDDARLRLAGILRAIASDPMQRWRVRLLRDRFPDAELWPDGPPPSQLPDPALEALAVQMETGWRCGIELINQVLPGVAADLASTLSAVVRLPDGELLPAWPLDESATDQLFRTLIQPTVTRAQKADAARAFLAGVPDAAAWVIDDAGDASSNAAIGFTDLIGRRTNVAVRLDASPAAAPVSVIGHESTILRTAIERDPDDPRPRRTVALRAGSWSAERALIAGPLPVTPPGLTVGPLVAEWAQSSWITDRPRVAEFAAAGLLQRAASGDAWELFIRCPRTSAAAADDRVRLWLGPYGSERAVITLSGSGESTLAGPGGRSGAGAAPAPIAAAFSTRENEWSALVRLPAGAIDPDGATITLGFDRVDGSGRRSSWPRPMTPGQIEPGRVRIDLSSWGGLTPQR